MDGWMLYSNAWIPTSPPHEIPDLDPILTGRIWAGGGLFARWTENFDCNVEMPFYYVIKDSRFDIADLKSKRRYEIKKGMRNFEVRQIEPCQMVDELYEVQKRAFSAYPIGKQPVADKMSFPQSLCESSNLWFGGFGRDDGRLYGYANVQLRGKCADFKILKTDPKAEKKAINAALVAGLLTHLDDFISNDGYICDGARNMRHQTHFQDYLQKYFGFRKAYCTVHMAYPAHVKLAVKMLYPLRGPLGRFNSNRMIGNVSSVLAMEEIARQQGDPHAS